MSTVATPAPWWLSRGDGGASPGDSPWLRRPDVLASMLRWVNHLELDLFICRHFCGPTSQAPRIDEARQDAVAGWNWLQQVNSESTRCRG